MTKLEQSIALIQKTEKLALKYQDFGFHVAFSGGKDSQVIYELCKMAGVKFKAFFYKTSIDPPELLKFIRENYPDVIWLYPKMTMYQLILKKGLPNRKIRFCCEYLKERQGLNATVITGIRKAEGHKRLNRKNFEHRCIKGNDKILLNPILDWTDNEIWQFLIDNKIQSCSLYKIRYRIGCVGCPMSPKTMRMDFVRYPNFKKAYINTVKKIMIKQGKFSQFESAEDVIEWWSSGISIKQWLANKNQYKINYD